MRSGPGETPARDALPRPVLALGGAVVLLLLLVARRYGWHRDELYFLEVGQHLQWGYVDQPPFTPFVARVAHELAPGNLVVLRTFPAVAMGATVVVGALVARELGGHRRAQIGAAAMLAGGGFLLGVGHLLSTAAFDLALSIALLWASARLLRTGRPRWWLAFGAIAGFALLNKSLVVLLVISLGIGLVAERRWELLRSPWVIAGAALAAALAAPNLAWQASNDWPQLDMAEALSERLAGENRSTLVPVQLLFVGPFLIPLLWRGARWLARDDLARPFRALLWAWPAVLVITFITGGRPYYALPLTLAVGLAGVVEHEQRDRPPRTLATCIALNTAISIPLALPVLPLSATKISATVNEAVAETVGWPELVDQVAAAVDALPARERATVVLLTGSYGEAGAIDRFGPARGLPPAYSGHNGYGLLREPQDDSATVVAVRYRPEALAPHFEACEQVATVDNGFDIDNEVQGTPILVCRGLRGTWATVWPQLRHLS